MVAPLLYSDTVLDDIVNEDTLSSAGTIIQSTGALSVVTNSGFIVSFEENAIEVSGQRSRILNTGDIVAANAGILATGDNQSVFNLRNITSDTFGVRLTAYYQAFNNGGDIHAEQGIAVRSTGDYAGITNSGLLSGGTSAISSSGDYVSIINTDRILSDDDGGVSVLIEGDNATFINNYVLGGGSLLLVTGDNAHIVNSGVMYGAEQNVASLRFQGDIDTTFINNGDMMPTCDIAIIGADGRDDIRNAGRIGGNVRLGDGNDTFDNRGGYVDTVRGGRGNDHYYIGEFQTFVEAAGEGRDTVYSETNASLGDNFERLVLLGDNDAELVGNEGRNSITGNSGDNVMWGRGGRDVFVFLANAGDDTIGDFSGDSINLSAIAGIERFSTIRKAMEKVGDDVVIDLSDMDGGFRLTLQDMTITQLHRENFIF